MNLKQNFVYLFILFSGFLFFSCQNEQKTDENWTLSQKLSALENVQIMTEKGNEIYPQSYKLLIRQPISHKDTSLGFFWQKVYLSHKNLNRPTTIITEGYTANYNYISEIADFTQTNQIIVEHRYFGESKPDSLLWEYLNLEQATADLHYIKELFATIYTKKWLSSGISKGGQTSIAYSYFYPKDVDASVPYVAPLTLEREDSRIPTFIKNIPGNELSRKKVYDFQILLLKNKKKLLPAFKKLAKSKAWTFNAVGGIESGFEHGVLEFSFALWQWGYSIDKIPENIENVDSLMSYLSYTDPFSFFSDNDAENLRPYFYQALSEMGIYTYDTEPFSELLDYAQNPNFEFTMENKIPTNYSNKLNIEINNWVKNSGNNSIYVYGGYDPWYAAAVELDSLKINSIKLVKPDGSHRTRLHDFSESKQREIKDSLEKWLNTTIE